MSAQRHRTPIRAIPAAGRREGFTLLELLLVLAVLVLLGALGWPMLAGALDEQRLRSAADEIRVQFVEARINAVSQGRIYQFRFQPDGDRYVVQWMPTPEAVTADEDLSAVASGSLENTLEGGAPVESRLSEGIRFAGGSVASDLRAEATLEQSDAAAVAGAGLSEPILFYTDGSTSTAALRLRNKRGHAIEVLLRGSTGVVTVSPLTSSEEVAP